MYIYFPENPVQSMLSANDINGIFSNLDAHSMAFPAPDSGKWRQLSNADFESMINSRHLIPIWACANPVSASYHPKLVVSRLNSVLARTDAGNSPDEHLSLANLHGQGQSYTEVIDGEVRYKMRNYHGTSTYAMIGALAADPALDVFTVFHNRNTYASPISPTTVATICVSPQVIDKDWLAAKVRDQVMESESDSYFQSKVPSVATVRAIIDNFTGDNPVIVFWQGMWDSRNGAMTMTGRLYGDFIHVTRYRVLEGLVLTDHLNAPVRYEWNIARDPGADNWMNAVGSTLQNVPDAVKARVFHPFIEAPLTADVNTVGSQIVLSQAPQATDPKWAHNFQRHMKDKVFDIELGTGANLGGLQTTAGVAVSIADYDHVDWFLDGDIGNIFGMHNPYAWNLATVWQVAINDTKAHMSS